MSNSTVIQFIGGDTKGNIIFTKGLFNISHGISVNGGLTLKSRRILQETYNITSSDFTLLCVTNLHSITLILPKTKLNPNRIYTIINYTNDNSVIIKTNEGELYKEILNKGSVTIQCILNKWYVLFEGKE